MGPQVQLSDLVGEHGPYQLFLSVLLFVRYVLLGLMANSGPLLTPDVTFYCNLPMAEVLAIMPNISQLSDIQRELEIKEEFKRVCQLELHLYQTNATHLAKLLPGYSSLQHANDGTPNIRECTQFKYDIAPDQGRTMTSQFDLVCDRDWLRSLYQSVLSASIVLAHVICGTFSDKYGRYQAQQVSYLISLVAGFWSLLAADFWTFILARALCSFGDLGLVVSLTTTLVELVGNRYRGLSVAVVNFGYALGVTLLPYTVAYFEDFRHTVSFALVCHLLTGPFILVASESIRWQVSNWRFEAAKLELSRIREWNNKFSLRRIFKLEQDNDQRISTLDEQKFQLLFSTFIQQAQSQNICDPLANSGEPETENFRLDEVGATTRKKAPRLSCGSLVLHLEPATDQEAEVEPKARSFSCTHLSGLVLFENQPAMGSRSRISPDGCKTSSLRPRAIHKCNQPDCINLVAHQLSFVGRVSRLFKDKQLMVIVITIVWTTFNSELQYTSYIIINLEVGEDLYLNYVLGGCMEALAAVTASLLLSYAPRRSSLVAFWLLISVSCFGLSIAHIDSTWAVWLLALAKFSQSALSSIASVAAYESFPTFLRQSGSGLVFTLGMLGSVFAPLIFAEFDDQAGMDRVLMTFSLSSLTAAILIYLYLKETRGCELQ